MITHTITGLELSWSIIALLGLIVQIALLHRTTVDLIVSHYFDGNPTARQIRTYAAKTSVIIFLGGSFWQVSVLIVGIIAMTQPSVKGRVTAASIATGAIFIIAEIIGLVLAIIIYHRRIKIVEMIESNDKERDERERSTSH